MGRLYRIWRFSKRRRRIVLIVCGIALLCFTAHLWGSGALHLVTTDRRSPCGSRFLLSEAVQPWQPNATTCRRQQALPSRLLRAAAALGRPPAVAFVGDSRARELHDQAVLASGRPPVPLPPRLPIPDICVDPGSSPEYQCQFGMCSQDVVNDVLASRLAWRTQMSGYMTAVLDNMTDACAGQLRERRRQHGGCPDTVVVNSGLWYTYRMPVYGGNRRETLVALFRHGMWQLTPSLARLARSTHTVWKLDEAMFSEFVKDTFLPANTKAEVNALLMVQHAVVYDVVAEIPQLVVWSSLLPQTTRHMFHVCARTRPRKWAECPDSIHMGQSLQVSFVELILGDVCDRALGVTR